MNTETNDSKADDEVLKPKQEEQKEAAKDDGPNVATNETQESSEINEVSLNNKDVSNNNNVNNQSTTAAKSDSKVSPSLTEPSEIDDDNDDELDDDDDGDDDSEMPLLKYLRMEGSLPRKKTTTANKSSIPLSPKCKCSTMGRVTISPSYQNESSLTSVAEGLGLSNPLTDSSHGNPNPSSSSTNVSESQQQNQDDTFYASRTQTFHVLAMAMDDGKIHLVDARTGINLCQPSQLQVVHGNHNVGSTQRNDGNNVVALSFDASGTYLAAVTSEGDVGIFEFKFGLRTSATNGTNKSLTVEETNNVLGEEKRPERKVFDSFLSRIAGDDWTRSGQERDSLSRSRHQDNDPSIDSTTAQEGQQEVPRSSLPMLMLTHPISTARFTHKSSNSKSTKATCISLDPSYKRKRDKCVIVGFSNGRLLFTKRSSHGGTIADSSGFGGVMGNLLQPKRHDVDLFQSVAPAGSKTVYHGIEYVTWRGSLVSWADAR